MNILVTGTNGFIGSHLADYLESKKHSITRLSQFKTGKKNEIVADLTQKNIEEKLGEIKKIECIHHVAANANVWDKNPELFETNINGTKQLLELARKWDAKIIFSSSASVYGNQQNGIPQTENGPIGPTNNYGLSKIVGEKMLESYNQTYGITTTSLRYFNTYGIREHEKGKNASMVYQFLDQIKNGKIVIYGNGLQSRDFVCVNDTVQIHEKVMNRKKGNTVLNVGSGVSTSFNRLAELCLLITGRSVPIQHIKNPHSEYQNYTMASVSKLKKETGMIPATTLFAGIKQMKEYYY